ncbi:hypothetical protein [Actinomyces dentalis]|uniref:hypothetical protein n=1 Tax=Actinomyces dentalis TaxID=272548 RepID=UPI000418DE65|nr:hypothetical protein [Actinomyces dentalis]
MVEFEPFHSAVNRIPVLRDKAQGLAEDGMLPEDLFATGKAPGHDHLEPEKLSGSIDLEMILRTPLVFGEQTVEHEGGKERHFIDLPMNDDGGLVVPPTMIKGMISRAYETLTCSRFRVFGDTEDREGQRRPKSKHSDRLTYRGDPASALQLVPLRLEKKNSDGGFTAALLQGDTMVTTDYRENGITYPTMRAASLQAGMRGHAKLCLQGGLERLERMTPHLEEIRCHMTLCLHGDRGRGARYAYWQVTHIQDNSGNFVEAFRINDSVTTIEDMDNVPGYVYRSTAEGDSPSKLFPRKHDERVFFDVSRSGPERVTVSKDVLRDYRIVVDSYIAYREEEERLNLPLDKRHRPNRATAEARDGEGAPADLKKDDLAYAVVERNRDGSHAVRQLLPVMIGRRAYRVSPRDLAELQGILPVSDRDGATAADRLFGYVVPEAEDGARRGDVSSRGRLIFGAVDASRAKIGRKEKTLSPLLQPKTTSARRFLTDSEGRTPTDEKGAPLARGEHFASGQFLGAAAYPVHRTLVERKNLDDSGFPRRAQDEVVLAGRKQDNIGVRLTARSWVKIGSRLRCRVSFSNLSRNELTALVWVLTPKNLVPPRERNDDPRTVGFLQMGLGKPLGLGALEVRIAEGGLHVISGKDLGAAYEDLSGCLGESESRAQVSEYSFAEDVRAELERQPWVQALQRAAFGYTDGKEVRYMSLEENKANNQTDFKTGKPKERRGLSPQDLHGDGSHRCTHIPPDEKRAPRSQGPRPRYRRGR